MAINIDTFPLLKQIDNPAKLRDLSLSQLQTLAVELRQYIIETLNLCGGHFGSNLGAVELSIALHKVFTTPFDQLFWDVGHQAYAHKVLTGRRDLLHTIRQTDGLAPFPKREESEYDCFNTGHASTSISAALGAAIAAQLANVKRKSVAIIGDGSMTGGMAFEALNHAGDLHADLLVILNDNDMSISDNVGALGNYVARFLSGSTYNRIRERGKQMLSNMPAPMWGFAKRTEENLKDMINSNSSPSFLFSTLGFHYFGPIDGHDLTTLIKTLQNLREHNGPCLLHIITKKGKGFAPAEADPIEYHAVKPGYLTTPNQPNSSNKPTYSNIFGQWLCDMAAKDERLIGITPAMREGSDLIKFSELYPKRYFDVGIAEQHALTFAAGLAIGGKKPVVAIYSTFLQRAYDQLIHDIALQNLPVVLAIDRAGIVGGDGSTHMGNFDISYLRAIPNMMIMAPADENETRQMLYTAFLQDCPTAVRYPRGTGPGVPIQQEMQALPIGKAEIRRQGKNIAILAFGSMVATCLHVADEIDATVVNMRFIKPLDKALIKQMAMHYDLLVTVEENAVQAGAGSAINEYLASQNLLCPVLNIGIPDQFIEHGKPEELISRCGLDKPGILRAINTRVAVLQATRSESLVLIS